MTFYTEYFTETTAQDEDNCFFSEIEKNDSPITSKFDVLSPGSYRILDGHIHQIISDLPLEEIRNHLRSGSKVKQ